MAWGRNEVVDGKKIKQKKKDKENNHSLCAVPKKNTMQMYFYLYWRWNMEPVEIA